MARKSADATPTNNGQETGQRADIATRFAPGNSFGRGRPKGSRNQIGEDFLKDAIAAWAEHGKDALQKMATKAPEKFCVMVAGLLPKEIEVKDQLSDLTDEQLDALYEFLDGEVRSEGPGGEAPRQKKSAKPAPVLRTLQ